MSESLKDIAIVRNNAFNNHNHFVIEKVEIDYAEVTLDVCADSLNIYNVVHGGALFSMADTCAGLTARSRGDEFVTANASIQFIRNVKEGRITARSRVISRGRTICNVEVEVRSEDDTLLFNGIFSMFCTTKR